MAPNDEMVLIIKYHPGEIPEIKKEKPKKPFYWKLKHKKELRELGLKI